MNMDTCQREPDTVFQDTDAIEWRTPVMLVCRDAGGRVQQCDLRGACVSVLQCNDRSHPSEIPMGRRLKCFIQ